MQLLHDKPKRERIVRAYLNQSWLPPGFKGNPYQREGKPDIAHDTTDFYLSRYSWIREILANIPFSVLRFDEVERIFSAVGKVTHVLMDGKRRVEIGHTNVEVPRLIGEYLRLQEHVKRDIPTILARWKFEEFEKPLDVTRKKGPKTLQYRILHDVASDPAFAKEGNPDFRERTTRELLKRWIHSQYTFFLEQGDRDDAWNDTLGRMHFSEQTQSAWRFLRDRLWSGVDEASVKAALDMDYGIEQEPEDERARAAYDHKLAQTIALLNLHQKYAFQGEIEWRGRTFRIEASPFMEKPVGSPVGNFDAVVFPVSGGLEDFLREIAMPDFEHADGGFVSVRFTIQHGNLILEESQSDVPAMLRLQSREAPAELADIVSAWPDLARDVASRVARHFGFTEMYGATPYRVIHRYTAAIHPDKTRSYFGGMERAGGKLVYDDEGIVDKPPQHYFRFEL